ncbi:MAG TPA: hypothetical protein VJP77_05215, partial [Planctomycetota bacterium]|nr:hypothetical protein [Planctomycetota bacterium]
MPQTPVTTVGNANILDAAPLSTGRAVFSRPAGGGDPELIFAGLGSGLAVLTPDPTTGAPVLYAGTSGTPQDSRLDVGGFVRRVLVFEDRIFVAADRAGLV